MSIKLLSLPAVSAARRNEAKATTYLRIKQGLLTKPVKLGRSSAWPENEIEAINAAIIKGASDDEIRALVGELHAARTQERELRE
jgi:prophage regulatory protein